ncbi:hypothetical protein B0A55_10467 [Friedmanniomyces simplex]|uniref:Uncharacterized protein n=1 Tax=Friedmanniomyces simplex TaxID=329884 RepID=A0A4U0X7F3_9PEZI|nr:hypothetical protein B0A55_10467 [Friedmanniomyces simplex]
MLSASPFAQYDTEQYVERILQTAPFSYIHVWAIRQSVRKKDRRSTEEVRRLFESVSSQAARQEFSKDLRINAQIGRLQAIYAAYLCHYGTLDQAEAVLSTWRPLHAAEASELERTVSDRISLVRAKTLRYRGRDEDARLCLEALKRHSQVKEDAFQAELTRNLLELTLDLKHVDELPASMFGPAQKLLHTTLNRADTHFKHHRYDDALADYQSAAEQSAEEDWLKVESLVAGLEWREGFAFGLIKLSLGVLTDDLLRMEHGTRVLKRQGLAAWLVGGPPWVEWV